MNKYNIKFLFRLLRILSLNVRYGNETKYYQLDNKRYIEVEMLPVSNVLKSGLPSGAIIPIKEHTIYTILHEIGHYLVTPNQRRKLPDYGIPRYKISDTTEKRFKYDLEEYKAFLVARKLEKRIGIKESRFANKQSNFKKIKMLSDKWWCEDGDKLVDTILQLC